MNMIKRIKWWWRFTEYAKYVEIFSFWLSWTCKLVLCRGWEYFFILSLVFLFEKRNVFCNIQLQSWITLENERMTILERGSKSSLIKTYLLSMRKICFQLFALVLTSRFSCRKKSTKYYKGIWPQKCSMKGIFS